MTSYIPPQFMTPEQRREMARDLHLPEDYFDSVQKYDPNQPRHPAGSSVGGQFAPKGGAVGGGADVIFEVAPDPNDKALTGRWNKLSDKEKQEVSETIAKHVSDEVAKELGLTKAELVTKIGGYLGDTNPSMALNVDPDKAVDAAKLLGYSLRQDSMMLASSSKAPGLDAVEAVVIRLPKGSTDLASVRKVYDEIYAKVPEAAGFSLFGDQMTILNFPNWETGKLDTSTEKLAESVDKALGSKYDMWQDTGYSAFIDNKDYLNAGNSEAKGRETSSWGRRANRLRDEASAALEKELGRRGKSDGFQVRYLLRVKYDPNQPRNPAGTPGGGRWTSQGAFGFHAYIKPGADKNALEQGEFWFAKTKPNTPDFPEVSDPAPDDKQGDLFAKGPHAADLKIEPGDTLEDVLHGKQPGLDFHNEHVKEHTDYRWKKMSDDEQTAISDYQGSEYRDINEAARHGYDHYHMADLDSALGNAPHIPEGTTLYRGFRHYDLAQESGRMIGQSFTEKGFMSTSTSPQLVNDWLSSKYETENLVALRLHVAKPVRGLYLAGQDKWSKDTPYEYEVLLNRNTSFTIIKSQKVIMHGHEGEAEVTVIDAVPND